MAISFVISTERCVRWHSSTLLSCLSWQLSLIIQVSSKYYVLLAQNLPSLWAAVSMWDGGRGEHHGAACQYAVLECLLHFLFERKLDSQRAGTFLLAYWDEVVPEPPVRDLSGGSACPVRTLWFFVPKVLLHFSDRLGSHTFPPQLLVKYISSDCERFVERPHQWVGETRRQYCCLVLWSYPFLLHFLWFLMARSQRVSVLIICSFPAGPPWFFWVFVFFLSQAGVFKLTTHQIWPHRPPPKPPAPKDIVPRMDGLTEDRNYIGSAGWICQQGAILVSQFTPGRLTVITSNYFKCFLSPGWERWDSSSCHKLIRLWTCSPVNFNLIIFHNSIISINFSIWIQMRCYLLALHY